MLADRISSGDQSNDSRCIIYSAGLLILSPPTGGSLC